MIVNCGCRKTLTILTKWPSYAMMPMFSIFTFSTEKIGNKKYLVCSTRWTLVNLGITLAGLIFGIVYFYLAFEAWFEEYWQTRYSEPWTESESALVTFIVAPLMFLAITFYAILMTVKSCICACSCGPFLQRSGLDIETLEVVDLEEVRHQLNADLELQRYQ